MNYRLSVDRMYIHSTKLLHTHSYLTIQYRMNKEIMDVCNHLIYQNRMQCANIEVASRRLQLLKLNDLPRPRDGSKSDWLFQALAPHRPVVFLNTDNLGAVEVGTTRDKAAPSSIAESELIVSLLWGLSRADYNRLNDSTAVITPFRAQVQLIQTLLATTVSGTYKDRRT